MHVLCEPSLCVGSLEKEDKELIEFIETLQLHKTKNPDIKIPVFPVLNKVDLPGKLDMPALERNTFEQICQVSALNGNGLSTLEEKLISEFKEFTKYTPERPIIFTKRQQEHLSETLHISKQCIQLSNEVNNYSVYLNDMKQNLLRCIDNSQLS